MLRNERGEPDWKALVDRVDELNANARSWECYKVLYLARHGQGFHNVASKFFNFFRIFKFIFLWFKYKNEFRFLLYFKELAEVFGMF